MATTDLERLIVKLDADLRSYEKALAKAQGMTTTQMRKVERTVQSTAGRIEAQFNKMAKSFAKGFLAGAGIAAIKQAGDAIRDVVAEVARLGDVADRIGLGTTELQAFQRGAAAAGMDFEELTSALIKFQKAVGEAQGGQGELLKLFQANRAEIQGNLLDNLKIFADLVARTDNEADALRLTLQSMGKSSEGMIEFLSKGGAGLDKMIDKMREMDTAINQETIKEMQALDDEWAEMTVDMSLAWDRFVVGVVRNWKQAIKDLRSPEGLSAIEQIWNKITGRMTPAEPILPMGGVPRTATGPGILAPKGPTTVLPDPDAARKAREAAAEAKRLEKERLNQIQDFADAVREFDERRAQSFADSIKGIEDETRALELEAHTYGMTVGERETYLKQQELINAAMENGIVLTPQVIAQIDEVAAAYGRTAAAATELANRTEALQELNATFQQTLSDIFMSIAEGVDPVEALTDALKDLAKQLTQIALNRALTQLISGSPGTTGGGLFGSLFGTAQHQGGLVGRSGSKRSVSAAAFIGAPRMHNGGIAGDEVPTILKKGELVLPKGFMPGGGSGGVTVIDQRRGGEPIKAQDDPRGGKMLFIRDAVRAEMSQFLGGDQGAKLMNAKYGVTPRVTSW